MHQPDDIASYAGLPNASPHASYRASPACSNVPDTSGKSSCRYRTCIATISQQHIPAIHCKRGTVPCSPLFCDSRDVSFSLPYVFPRQFLSFDKHYSDLYLHTCLDEVYYEQHVSHNSDSLAHWVGKPLLINHVDTAETETRAEHTHKRTTGNEARCK